MENVNRSYAVAKQKNISRFSSLLNDDDKSTILFVSKYGSVKQGFLNDFINNNIKEETLVMNFMYFSELHTHGKKFDIGEHFEKQLNIYSEVEKSSATAKKLDEVEEEKKNNKSKVKKVRTRVKFINGLIIMFDALLIAAFNMFIVSKIELGDYVSFLDGKDQIVNYSFYGLSAIIFIFGLILALQRVEVESEDDSIEVVEEKIVENVVDVVEDDAAMHTITNRSISSNNLHQTQSLDFSELIDKKQYEFDLSGTNKKYFVLYGLDEYVDFVKTQTGDSVSLIKDVSDFMIKVYSTFKKFSDRKLIFVWKDKVFINQDLTLLIFDEIFTLFGDFDEMEMQNHIESVFKENEFNVSSDMLDVICNRVNYLSDVDTLAFEMKKIVAGIDGEFDIDKLAYIQFLKLFENDKVEKLKTYFKESNRKVAVSNFTLTNEEFELYYETSEILINNSSHTVGLDENEIDYIKVIGEDSNTRINYKIIDELDLLVQYVRTLPNENLHQYLNLDLLKYLLQGDAHDLKLGQKILFSMMNLQPEQFAVEFKSLFNGLAKNSKKEDYSVIVQAVVGIMLSVERKKRPGYMYEIPATYIKCNRKTAIMMIRHIEKKLKDFDVFNKNEELIHELLDEAVRKK